MVASPYYLPRADTRYVGKLLCDAAGRLRALPAAELAAIQRAHLCLWAQSTSRYGLPTVELLDLLRRLVGGRRCIEIGAGLGDLGRLLGVPMTDSAVQVSSAELKAYYAALNTPAIDPPSDVERLEAAAAIEKYRPEVVVASWVTQRYQPGDEGPPRIGSSLYGVDELALLKRVATYIHIGNVKSHHDKRIRARPHRTLTDPRILFSRSIHHADNCIYIWGPG